MLAVNHIDMYVFFIKLYITLTCYSSLATRVDPPYGGDEGLLPLRVCMCGT